MLDKVRLAFGNRNRLRHEQRLANQCAIVEALLEFFVRYALMRRMHVDNNQAVFVLGKDVDACELRDSETERRHLGACSGTSASDGAVAIDR